jgi:hypothetical protein
MLINTDNGQPRGEKGERMIKSPKKSAAKAKTAPQRTVSQPVSSRMRVYNLTREIPQDKYFILANGKPVKNVAELAALLDQLEDHVFSHHVTTDRNDFHNWVRDVFEDLELARKIAGINDKKHMQLIIYRHLAGHE